MISSEQAVQKVCTEEPVVPTPFHGWLQSRVVEPVIHARTIIDEFERINGKLNQLDQVKSDLDGVKESCKNLSEEIIGHDEELVTTKHQLAELQQTVNDMKKQRDIDVAKSLVERAILKAEICHCRSQLGSDIKDVKIDIREGQSKTDCALKSLKNQQKVTSKSLTSLENEFEKAESRRQREERRAERRSRADGSSLEQSLEASVELRNEALQNVRNRTPEPIGQEEGPIRFRLDSGVSISSNISFEMMPNNTLTIPEEN